MQSAIVWINKGTPTNTHANSWIFCEWSQIQFGKEALAQLPTDEYSIAKTQVQLANISGKAGQLWLFPRCNSVDTGNHRVATYPTMHCPTILQRVTTASTIAANDVNDYFDDVLWIPLTTHPKLSSSELFQDGQFRQQNLLHLWQTHNQHFYPHQKKNSCRLAWVIIIIIISRLFL